MKKQEEDKKIDKAVTRALMSQNQKDERYPLSHNDMMMMMILKDLFVKREDKYIYIYLQMKDKI